MPRLPKIESMKRELQRTISHTDMSFQVAVEVTSVCEVAASGVGVIAGVGTSFSEITESIKRQPLYCLVGCVHWVWYYLFCSCLYISYITPCTGIKQPSKRYKSAGFRSLRSTASLGEVLFIWLIFGLIWSDKI